MLKINCIVYSITVDSGKLTQSLRQLENTHPLLILTSHFLFDFEKNEIMKSFNGKIIYKSMSDFISDEEAEGCDRDAYNLCIETGEINNRDYMARIKELKNLTIIRNIKKEYTINNGFILSNDLGIDQNIWLDYGFVNHTSVKSSSWSFSSLHPIILKQIISIFKKLFIKNEHYSLKYSILRQRNIAYLFCGNITRVQQYFQKEIIIERVQFPKVIQFFILVPILGRHIEIIILSKLIRKNNINTIFSSIHEHHDYYKEIARKSRVEYGLLQDGYIPENYPPYLYKIEFKGAKFYVWDKISAEFFVKNQMQVDIHPLYASRELPEVNSPSETIKTVVILTSGAGDWTAVKNRSDDDLMLMAFVEIARKLKHINFIYRCHPLWVHPTHQGENSIKRAIVYLKNTDLKNIEISAGSVTQSKRYSQDGQLYVIPTSMVDDMAQADLVFGEHSYSMIDAARAGKLFASVLIAKRRNFFNNYTKMGFHHFTNSDDIISFIKELNISPDNILDKHNAAVRCNNIIVTSQNGKLAD